MGKVLLIDGYNLAFRAFYGMPDLKRAEDGFPTGAIHGWIRTLWRLEDDERPDRMVVFFDLGGAARQLALLGDYKAQRGDTPPELERQIPVIKRLTAAMGWGGIEKAGVEADDLIGSWSRRLAREGHDVGIVSADKDLAQCVGNGVWQLLPPPTANPKLGWRRLEEADVKAKFGVGPGLIADYLAIIGDTSDNIPGVKGVGPKTAAKWLQQYGSLEAILNHCGELKPVRFQSLVYAERAILERNLALTTLDFTLAEGDLPDTSVDFGEADRILGEMAMQKARQDFLARSERARS